MWNVERLLAALEDGDSPGYVLFWGHTPKERGRVDAACFSQWFARPFESGGQRYETAEHFMMGEKARLFGDEQTRERILAARTPAEAKALGRAVKGFDDDVWTRERFDVVVRGNLAKFGQHDDLRAWLLASDDRVLVEASPTDRVWGIGLAASDPNARVPARWKGLNLLGFALMTVREQLRDAK